MNTQVMLAVSETTGPKIKDDTVMQPILGIAVSSWPSVECPQPLFAAPCEQGLPSSSPLATNLIWTKAMRITGAVLNSRAAFVTLCGSHLGAYVINTSPSALTAQSPLDPAAGRSCNMPAACCN